MCKKHGLELWVVLMVFVFIIINLNQYVTCHVISCEFHWVFVFDCFLLFKTKSSRFSHATHRATLPRIQRVLHRPPNTKYEPLHRLLAFRKSSSDSRLLLERSPTKNKPICRPLQEYDSFLVGREVPASIKGGE